MLLLQERIPKQPRPVPHTAEVTGGQRRRPRGNADPRLRHARHADTRGPAAVQRPLPRDGHQRRRRLQPLEGSRRDPLARRRHLRQLGHVLLHPRRGQRDRCGPPPPADPQARRIELRGDLLRRAGRVSPPRFAGSGNGDFETHTEIVVSPEDDIELRRVRITNRSRQRREIDVTSYAEIVSHRRPRTNCIPRSATCSSRPSCCASGRPSCARAGRARRASRRPGCCT
jgi:hypothetical protein